MQILYHVNILIYNYLTIKLLYNVERREKLIENICTLINSFLNGFSISTKSNNS